MGILDCYSSVVFDCDGVILDSNEVKTNAFYNSTVSYGDGYARALVEYHKKNGGVSRYEKYKYFLTDILGGELCHEELNSLINDFASQVRQGLMTCGVAPGLEDLRKQNHGAKWFVVSGGDEAELREVFAARCLDHLFDGGIFGSPDSKDLILAREFDNANMTKPGIFLGDSKYDFESSRRAGLDFIFISGWSEFVGWESYFDSSSCAGSIYFKNDILGLLDEVV